MDKNILGSSETTREAPLETSFFTFDFDLYLCPQHKKIDPCFLEWFIGFSEGDGCFITPKNQTKKCLSFEIVQKDAKIIHKIRTQLGYGVVSICREKYWKYSVSDKKGLQRLVSLFSGNLVLPKRRQQFTTWIEVGNTLGLWSPPFIFSEFQNRLVRQVKPTVETGWFAGFVDAEGYFYANFSVPAPGSRMSPFVQKFQITQQHLVGEHQILEEFSRLFETSACLKLLKQPNVYQLEMFSLRSHELLIRYLEKFPLQTTKKIAFIRWWRIYLRRVEQKQFTDRGIDKLKRLCWAINRQTRIELEFKNECKKQEVDDIVHTNKKL